MPARIHNIGLEEVKRIRAEMEKTLEGINFLGTLDQFLGFIRNDPRFFYKTPEELLAAYEKTARGIEPQLPKLFGRLPKTRVRHPRRFPRPARRRRPRRITSRRRSTARGRATTT